MMISVVIPASIDILYNTFTREYSDAVIKLNTRNIGVIFIEILLGTGEDFIIYKWCEVVLKPNLSWMKITTFTIKDVFSITDDY